MVEEVNVMDEDWDYLIVLDACRYDYFSNTYMRYLCGKLKKIMSPGSSTIEWCKKTFQKRYDDVVYISANPYINSKVEVKGFDAKDNFYKVIDVWRWGWNEELGTVHPKVVNKAVWTFEDNYPNKRFIIHYLQPHAPYLGYQLEASGFPEPQINRRKVLTDIKGSRKLTLVERRLLKVSVFFAKRTGFLRKNPAWKIRELFNLPPATPMDAVRRKIGNEGLQLLYARNLRFVLEYVVRIIEYLSGVIIITADHGERLGEGGGYAHPSQTPDRILLEVPWFKVDKIKKSKVDYGDEEKKRIKREITKLRALGRL